jgi:hypothetical protein
MTQLFRRNWWLVALLIAAIFTRFYNIPDSLQFQGDQGRDAMIVARIFLYHDPVFIGPVTSVGNMYLGPLYYYFMLPFLWLSYPSPVGPAYGVALLGVLTVYFLYQWGKAMVGKTAALFAATLFTFSATITLFSRFSWNPNPAPFVSLSLLYALWLTQTKSAKYWWVVGLCIAILIQLHYLTLLAAAAAGGVWVWQVSSSFWQVKRHGWDKKAWWSQTRPLWQGTVMAAAIFLISLTPLMLFDWKHDWLNAKAFQSLIWKSDTFEVQDQAELQGLAKTWHFLKELDGRSMHVLFEYNIGKWRELNRLLVLVVIAVAAGTLTIQRNYPHRSGLGLILWFIAVGIVGTAAYQHTVFDHYIAYLFPVTALLLGIVLAQLVQLKLGELPFGKYLVIFCLGGFLFYNLPRLPLTSTGWTIADINMTSQSILDRVQPGEKYNIVLLSESGDLDGQNYRYFLTTEPGKNPVLPEHRDEAQTLFIINEAKAVTDVVSLPAYEIVTFPNHQVSEKYQVPNGPEISVLRR